MSECIVGSASAIISKSIVRSASAIMKHYIIIIINIVVIITIINSNNIFVIIQTQHSLILFDSYRCICLLKPTAYATLLGSCAQKQPSNKAAPVLHRPIGMFPEAS